MIPIYSTIPISICLLVAIGSSGCATNDPDRQAKTGAAIGAISGAVIGHQIDGDTGRFVGAAIGAIAGASVGRYQDEQQRRLERTLAAQKRSRLLEIKRLEDETIAVSLSSDACFPFDSSEIRPALYTALDRLASTVNNYDRTVLHVVGHTDNVGSDNYNRALSNRRAQAVAQYLMLKGVATSRLRIEGRGELEPRRSNDTAVERELNRRVEIHIKPIIDGEEERALLPPSPA